MLFIYAITFSYNDLFIDVFIIFGFKIILHYKLLNSILIEIDMISMKLKKNHTNEV